MNILKKWIKEVKELDAALAEYKTPEFSKPTAPPNPNPNYKPPAFVASPKQSNDKIMYGLKLYVTFEDINNYIQTKVDPQYKDCTFIPIKAEINENDLSIDVTLISTDDVGDKNHYRYKLNLDKLPKEE